MANQILKPITLVYDVDKSNLIRGSRAKVYTSPKFWFLTDKVCQFQTLENGDIMIETLNKVYMVKNYKYPEAV